MERKKATDFPQELLTIFDRYVHGEISRREFLDSAKKYAIGSLTALAIWESLRPNYALAQQVARDDDRLNTEYVTVPSPQGNGSIRGYFVRPAKAGEKLPGVLVIHENRGLNPYIEDVARRLGTSNFLAFAPDGLTSIGGYPYVYFGKIEGQRASLTVLTYGHASTAAPAGSGIKAPFSTNGAPILLNVRETENGFDLYGQSNAQPGPYEFTGERVADL